MTRPSLTRVVLIVGGYGAAFAAGTLAVWLNGLHVSPADQLAMSGMMAFGDAVAFLTVAAGVSVIPTVMLFQLIGDSPRFWRVYTWASVGWASTGVAAALCYVASGHSSNGLLQTLGSVAVLRAFAAPVFFLGYAPGLLPAARAQRRLAVWACGLELGALVTFVGSLLLRG